MIKTTAPTSNLFFAGGGLFEQAPIAIAVYRGPSFIVEIANEKVLEMWGRTAAQAIGKPLFDIFPERRDAQELEMFQHITFDKGERFEANDVKATFLRNGQIHTGYYHYIYEPLRDESGEVTGVMAIAIEVTNQVYQPFREADGSITGITCIAQEMTTNAIANKKIKASEANVRNIFTQAPVAVSVFRGPQHVVELANVKMLELWGTSLEQVLFKPIFEGLPEAAGQGFEQLLDGVYHNGESTAADEIPATLPRPGGLETVFINFVYEPIREADGTVSGVMAVAIDVTQAVQTRKKIEESAQQLQQAQNELELALNTGNIGVWYYDLRNDTVKWSKEQAAMYLEEAGVFENGFQKWRSYIHPDDIDRVEKVFQDSIATGKDIYYNLRIIRADGSIRWLQAKAEVSLDAEGKAAHVLGVSLDVTEQKLAEEALRESEQRYRVLSDALEQKVQDRTYELAKMNEAFEHAEAITGMGNYKWDFQTSAITWSKGMYAIFGVPPENFRPALDNIMQFTHPEDVERVTANARAVFASETAHPIGYRIIAADGIVKHVYGSGVMIMETADRKILIGTLKDVTADKEKEQQLLEANEQLQLKNQEIALSKYNKRFLTDFSERFSAYKVHTEFFNSLVQYIADLTHLDYVLVGRLEETGANKFCVHTIAITAFGQLTNNIVYPLPDGPCEQVVLGNLYSYPENCQIIFPENNTLAQFNVEGYIGYPLYDINGKAQGLIAVMHERKIDDVETVSSILKIVAKRAEMELERIQQEQELKQSNQLLAEKNIALEKSNRDLEQFAHIASHDLQEPLRKIQMFTNLLQSRGDDKAELEKYSKKIEDSAARMSQLIQSVLNYSRVSQSQEMWENTDLNDLLKRISTDYELLIEEKNAVVMTEQLPVIPGMPLQLNQLFSNLLSNALKFCSEKPLIRISTRPFSAEKVAENSRLDPAREYVHIVFEDNGIGFSQQYAERIFAIFQRLHDKQSYAGTGIGLALCKKIVDNHHGDISAQGALGQGARFDIYLPKN